MGGTDGHPRDVVTQPGKHLLPHDAHTFRLIRLDDETLDEGVDDDGDGLSDNQGDCEDTDPSIRPGTLDIPGDGIDQAMETALICRREERRDEAYLRRLLTIARDEQRRRQVKPPARQRGLIEPLSERELEVLRLIAAGHTNAAIAGELYVVVGTVKAHANNIYGKLGVRNRVQAINRARELGLVD